MQTTPADVRNAVLLSVATMAAGLLVPVMPFVGIPLTAFALGWLTYRFGPVSATILTLVTSACVAVLWGLSVLDAMFVAVAMLATGPVTVLLLRRYRAVMVFYGMTLLTTAAALVAPIGTQTRQAILAAEHQYLTTPVAAGVTAANAAAARSMIVWLIAQTSALWPTAVFFTMGIGVAIGVPLVARAGRSLGLPVKGYGPLADVDVTFHLVWPAILGLGLTALAAFWHQAPALVTTVGENVVMIVRPMLFLQGAAVFATLYRRMGAKRLAATIGLVLLLLTEMVVPSVSILGAVDLFANLRKLPRAEAHGTPA